MWNHNILTPLQHGFCRQHSCETQRLLTLDDLARAYNQKHQVGIGVLDFSCALDTVPHRKLLKKLSHYGITSPIHSWIESFLCHCHMWVTVECASSSTTEVDSGVHQGTVLGPLLFLVFINDLPQQVSAGTTIWLFADDYLIYHQIKSPKDQGRPSMWSWTLEKWTKVWGMCFNPTKCTVLHSHHPQKPFTRFYSLWEEILSESSEAKYLGVVISSDLLCEKQVNAVSQKASNTLNFIRRNLKYCPQEAKNIAYNSLVRSTVQYCASTRDHYYAKDINKIERVNRRDRANHPHKFRTIRTSIGLYRNSFFPRTIRFLKITSCDEFDL